MFEDEFAKERQRLADDQRAAEQHEEYVAGLFAAKDEEIEIARAAARRFRALLWVVQDAGGLAAEHVAELDLLVETYTSIDPSDSDDDESEDDES